MLNEQNCTFDAARAAMGAYISARRGQPHFARARSTRSAFDRARLRPANRLVREAKDPPDAARLLTFTEPDLRPSGGLDIDPCRKGRRMRSTA